MLEMYVHRDVQCLSVLLISGTGSLLGLICQVAAYSRTDLTLICCRSAPD